LRRRTTIPTSASLMASHQRRCSLIAPQGCY